MDPVLDSEDNQKLKEDAVNSNSEKSVILIHLFKLSPLFFIVFKNKM